MCGATGRTVVWAIPQHSLFLMIMSMFEFG